MSVNLTAEAIKDIKVLSNATLSAEYIQDAPDDQNVFFYKNDNPNVKDWSLSKKAVQQILLERDVSVTYKSDKSNCGLFQIGGYSDWYYSHKLYPEPFDLEKEIYKLLVYSITGASLMVTLRIRNNTQTQLTKLEKEGTGSLYHAFPKTIEPQSFVDVFQTNDVNDPEEIKDSVIYNSVLGSISIYVLKTFNTYDSYIKIAQDKQLVGEVKIKDNSNSALIGDLLIEENLVLKNFVNLQNFFNSINGYLKNDQVLADGDISDLFSYNKSRQVFNRRFQLKPYAIIYCESKEDVQRVYKDAIKHDLPIRLRAGGHDHEAECSGTNTILIDVSRMNWVEVDPETNIASIGPGNRFIKLTTDLARNPGNPVMIPHGTCATVGISGFTFGGGWGPWTRAKGMCCEYLVGATIVLGDGTSIELSEDGDERSRKLLWALRGGGGFSYGIVTELRLQTFELPQELIKFEVEWNPYIFDGDDRPLKLVKDEPTKQVLQAWEAAINPSEDINEDLMELNDRLIGTNLKISGIPSSDNGSFKEDEVYHNCLMYGYWRGNTVDLEQFIEDTYSNVDHYEFRIVGYGGAGTEAAYGTNMMASNWDRISHYNITQLLQNKPLLGTNESDPLPPDYDAPAPHKITSRLVDEKGLSDYGAFLKTLTSPLILEGNRELGLFSYVTLGAIAGRFYRKEENRENNCAFPYKSKLYTIQYQTWWNTELNEKEEGEDNFVYDRTNRALDWMQTCRDAEIPNTSGAFISFKDSSIPTKTYFDFNYDELKHIKETYSEDPYNHFRTRKTII